MNFIEGMVLAGVFPHTAEVQKLHAGGEPWRSVPRPSPAAVELAAQTPAGTYRKSKSAWPLAIVLMLTSIGLGILLADKGSKENIPENEQYKVYRPAVPPVLGGRTATTSGGASTEEIYTDASGRSYSLSREDYNRLYVVKIRLNAMERAIEEKAKALNAAAVELDGRKTTLDTKNASAMAEYNKLLATIKKLDAEVESETLIYEAEAGVFNKELERVGRPVR